MSEICKNLNCPNYNEEAEKLGQYCNICTENVQNCCTKCGFSIGPFCDYCFEDLCRVVYFSPHPFKVIYAFEIDNHMYSDLPLGSWP